MGRYPAVIVRAGGTVYVAGCLVDRVSYMHYFVLASLSWRMVFKLGLGFGSIKALLFTLLLLDLCRVSLV